MFAEHCLVSGENLDFTRDERIFIALAGNAGTLDGFIDNQHKASNADPVSGCG
ncbi:MAG: hypothetical protein ABIT37_03500 [Luteolibacter sp.]